MLPLVGHVLTKQRTPPVLCYGAQVHSWIVRFEQSAALSPANFLVGVAPPSMDLNKSLGEEG